MIEHSSNITTGTESLLPPAASHSTSAMCSLVRYMCMFCQGQGIRAAGTRSTLITRGEELASGAGGEIAAARERQNGEDTDEGLRGMHW